jgi:hemerythrin
MESRTTADWNDRYLVGIQLIDDQHRELLRLIDNFYLGCSKDDETAKTTFKLTVHGLISYIKYHFATEEQLLERIKYPDISAHKRQHAEFTRDILERIDNFERGKTFSPRCFIRYVRDWILTHMALIDKKYATYIHFVNGQVNVPGRSVYEVPALRETYPAARPEYDESPSEMFFG